MKKKIIFFVFLGLFIFFGKHEILADESMTQIKWYKTDGKIERLSVSRTSGRSVCTVTEKVPDNYDFCSITTGIDFFYYQTDAVLTYVGEGKWQTSQCLGGVCVNSGSVDDKNGTAGCVYKASELPSCTNFSFDKNKITVGSWGCVSTNTYGRCTHDGRFACQQSCPDQGTCESSKQNRGDSAEPRYYNCVVKNCTEDGLLNGKSKCYLKEGVSKTLVKCVDGRTEKSSCPDGQQCFMFRDGEAQCHSVYEDVCVKLPSGQTVGPFLEKYTGCKDNQIIKCVAPPTAELGEDCSLTDKTCYPYPDKNEAKCLTKEEIGEYESSININTITNDEFWCPGGNTEIRTAIGCIPITVSGLVAKLLPNIFGIAGGIAFLMMVYGFIMMSTSSGDEKKVMAAKQIITSAIVGLLVSIFALFLYRLIAVDILQIPGIDYLKG